jgi:hypothetical protein
VDEGEVIDEYVSDQRGGGGVYSLALDISRDDKLIRDLDGYPDTTVVFESISKGSYEYGNTGVSFREQYPTYLDPWARNIMQTVKAQFLQHFPSVSKSLLTGGGAYLIEAKAKAINTKFKSAVYVTLEEPHLSNIRGMWLCSVA